MSHEFIEELQAHAVECVHHVDQDIWDVDFPAGVAVALSTKEDGTIMIDGITSRSRGQGHASAALRALCQVADRTCATLALVAQSYDLEAKSLDNRALAAWYKRHGFEGEIFLVRAPRFYSD